MPENLISLYQKIWEEANDAGLSAAQRHYAVGWIFFDLFERAEYEEKRSGCSPTAETIDRLAAEIPDGKIIRSIDEAQEEFGKSAASFMEDEIQIRIDQAIASSVVIEVKAIRSDIRRSLSGVKAFFANVGAGIISGFVFAVILMVAAAIWTHDPSPIQLEKNMMHDTQRSGRSAPTTGTPPKN